MNTIITDNSQKSELPGGRSWPLAPLDLVAVVSLANAFEGRERGQWLHPSSPSSSLVLPRYPLALEGGGKYRSVSVLFPALTSSSASVTCSTLTLPLPVLILQVLSADDEATI